jgi:hypothetical protein
VTLTPGNYALIFGGGGHFGATGSGAMPQNNTDIPGQASYFRWDGSNWQSGGFNNTRFVVVDSFAQAVPEPSSLALLSLGALGLITARRRKR